MRPVLFLVFSNLKYLVFSFLIFSSMMVGLLILSEYIFLEPYVVGHIPSGTEFGFVLVVAVSALSALVLPMNVFRINILKKSRQKMGGGLLGSVMGAIAGACSCGPVGFAVISTFGSVGATATAFLTNYEVHIRLLAVGILSVTYFTTIRSLKTECKFDPNS